MITTNARSLSAIGSPISWRARCRSSSVPQPHDGMAVRRRSTTAAAVSGKRAISSGVDAATANFCQQRDESKQVTEAALSRRLALSLVISGSMFTYGSQAMEAGDGDDDDVAGFYERWPYQQAADILPYIRTNATRGDSESILRAMDDFGQRYPMWKLGEEKGRMLENIVAARDPDAVLELGTFLGYSAIRIARTLRSEAHLTCIEGSSEYAAVARELLDMAGLGGKVTIVEGLASDRIPDVANLAAAPPGLIFEDHAKACYTPDLLAMESVGLVRPGTWVVADNVVYPGAPGFLEHLIPSNGYDTQLLEAAFEYEERWRPDWDGPHRDALSLSKFSGIPTPEEA